MINFVESLTQEHPVLLTGHSLGKRNGGAINRVFSQCRRLEKTAGH
jgi:hypothetical protein